MSFLSKQPLPYHDVGKSPSKPNRITSDVDSSTTTGVVSSSSRAVPFPFPASGQAFSPKVPDLAAALYSLPYGAHTPAPHLYPGFSSAIDPMALYTALNRMEPKNIPNNWSSMYSHLENYDAPMASLFYQGVYPSLMLGDRVPRKNATKETTATLKTWLNEHKKNPYPTKTEKVMLAMISKMTLTQVSTWFANARRRLKKDNKMTWSPRNRCSEDRESDDECRERSPISHIHLPSHADALGSSPDKNEDTSLSKPDILEGHRHTFHHYQQQMLLRQIASLSPHLRAPQAFRHQQEKVMALSDWKENTASDDGRSTSSAIIGKANVPVHIQQNIQSVSHRGGQFQRYNNSPPLTASQFERPYVSEQSLSGTSHLVSPLSQTDSVAPSHRNNEVLLAKHNPAFWSPVNLAEDKSRPDKKVASATGIHARSRLSSSPSSSGSLGSISERKSRVSVDSEVSNASCQSAQPEDFSSSPPMFKAKVHPGDLLAHQSIFNQQQLIAARLASFNSSKDAASLSRNQMVDHLRHFDPYRSLFSLPQFSPDKERCQDEKSAESPLRDDDENRSDQEANTPMNLSNRARQEEDDASLIAMKVGHENRSTSVAAN